MKLILCILLGYLIGMISPSALLSKLKNVNMKQAGTGNLGASNAILLLGKGYGMLVMVIDILKAFLACHIGQWIFPDWEIAAYVTGFGTILGHKIFIWLTGRKWMKVQLLAGMPGITMMKFRHSNTQ